MSLVVDDSMIVAGGAECKKNLTASVLQLSDLRAVGLVTSRGLNVGEITVTKASSCNSVNLMKDAHTNGSGNTKGNVTARDGMVVGGTATLSTNTFTCQSLVANNWQLRPFQQTNIKLTTSSAFMKALNTTGRLTVDRTIVVDGFTKTGNMSVTGKLVVDDDFTVNGNANNTTIRARQTFSTPTSRLVTISSATMGALVASTYTANANFTSNNMSCPNNLTAGTLSVGKDLDVQNAFRVGGKLTFTDTLFSRGDINIAVNANITKELTLSALKIKDTSNGFGCTRFSNTSDTKFTKQMQATNVVVKGLGALHTGDIKLSGTSKIDFGHMNISDGRVSGFNDVYYANGTFVTQDLGYTKQEFTDKLNQQFMVRFALPGSYRTLSDTVTSYTKKEMSAKVRERLVKLRKMNDDMTALSEYANSPRVFIYDIQLVKRDVTHYRNPRQAFTIAFNQGIEIEPSHAWGPGLVSFWSFSEPDPFHKYRQCEIALLPKGTWIEVQNRYYHILGRPRYEVSVQKWFWKDHKTLSFAENYYFSYLPELTVDDNILNADMNFTYEDDNPNHPGIHFVAVYIPTDGRPEAPPPTPPSFSVAFFREDDYSGDVYTTSSDQDKDGMQQFGNDYYLPFVPFGVSSYKIASLNGSFNVVFINDKSPWSNNISHYGFGSSSMGNIDVGSFRFEFKG
jgi:cytoskeletal protein CcmA (bactofilin family)